MALLTADQKKSWKDMTGEPFDYKPESSPPPAVTGEACEVGSELASPRREPVSPARLSNWPKQITDREPPRPFGPGRLPVSVTTLTGSHPQGELPTPSAQIARAAHEVRSLVVRREATPWIAIPSRTLF